ncbi:MAG: prepilin-type N-terminal cleavage/methylation domain-containing protein [Gammaproteobacteria bacterium]|nr:prepilin-type N-terminal cleavage/methylation domain-containing protein [Gammaproteobacteria bacterium]
MMHIQKKQNGITLIELMIAILVGLIVMAATIGIFVTTIKSNSDTLKMIRLNQELQAVMTLITRDIRRVGYWGDNISGTINPFTAASIASGAVNTLSFGYDADNYGVDDGQSENFGFRLNGSQVDMLDVADNWQPLTDPTVVKITGLTFDVAIWCPANPSCAAPVKTELRTVNIVLTGELSTDATVSRTLKETIRIRNDVVY